MSATLLSPIALINRASRSAIAFVGALRCTCGSSLSGSKPVALPLELSSAQNPNHENRSRELALNGINAPLLSDRF